MTKKCESIRVFIVDDHEVVRLGLMQFLESHEGVTVCGIAGDANTAIASINSCSPDVVVVDISLEGIGGIELIRAIQTRYRSIKVVAHSMHAEKEIVRRALQAGAIGYVIKSEPVGQLIVAIKLALKGKPYISSPLHESLIDIMAGRGEDNDPGALLTDRELEIFRLIGNGKDRRQIALQLGIGTSTIGTYRDRIKTKLGIQSSGELTRYAIKWASQSASQDRND